MAIFSLRINGVRRRVEAPAEMPLLWVLRDRLALTGTKYGCGLGVCGACTVHIDGEAARACQVPIGDLGQRRVTTIEGLRAPAVQGAWLEEDVAQCGYCQPGQIMQAVCLLAKNRDPSDADIDAAMANNVCRCGTYHRIRAAIRRAVRTARSA